jgi:hypothetical protein
MVELHQEILAELRRTIPCNLFPHLQAPGAREQTEVQTGIGRNLTRGVGMASEGIDDSWLKRVTGMLSDAQMAAGVAKVFSKKMHRFTIYQEYGANYGLMVKGVASVPSETCGWDSGQKGFESLASSIGSCNSRGDYLSRKSLTIHDLLVKPIQRICRYPLLFKELLRFTPVVDCPDSHMEVDNVLSRLQEMTVEVDRAAQHSQMKGVLETTWILQNRLVFPPSVSTCYRNLVR